MYKFLMVKNVRMLVIKPQKNYYIKVKISDSNILIDKMFILYTIKLYFVLI